MNIISKALSDETSDGEFQKLYGHKKPSRTDPIIIHCRSGRRSEIAVLEVLNLGYTK